MQLLALMQGSVFVTLHIYDFWEKGDSKLTTCFYLKTFVFIIINFLISKNKVGTFGCEWVALGFKADTSITFFHVEVTFDDVCSMLKHKILLSAGQIVTIV